jgi:hypothetical protein
MLLLTGSAFQQIAALPVYIFSTIGFTLSSLANVPAASGCVSADPKISDPKNLFSQHG